MNKVGKKILKKIDEKYVVNLLRKMVQIPSAFPDYEWIASFVKDEMKSYGLDVNVLSDEGNGWKRPNVIGLLRGVGEGTSLILAAHTDVVPQYDLSLWKVAPFSGDIIDNKIYGRGTADTKGSLAAMMGATAAVAESDVNLEGDLKLVAWAGDEYKPQDAKYFDGISYLALNDLIKGDAAVFGEPYDLKITYISRGRVWFEFEVGGVASHSATGAGVNAILKAMKLIEAVYRINVGEHPVTGKDTINVGEIKGGTQPNMVPDYCCFTFDIRFGSPLTTADVIRMVEDKVNALKKEDPNFMLRSMKVTERREPFGFERDSSLNNCLKKAGSFIGKYLYHGGAVSFGPIADLKDRVGLKEGCLFGPGKTEQAHAINEHMEIDDLITATKVLALTIPCVCKYT